MCAFFAAIKRKSDVVAMMSYHFGLTHSIDYASNNKTLQSKIEPTEWAIGARLLTFLFFFFSSNISSGCETVHIIMSSKYYAIH